ncbi:aldo/keto reductase [Polluticaenibacter yanchengensis]|uniref:Aldo/keto reductase n=1 Tax=Polluticaenibacter yanchengensis TaxID=3014562 RepID=A0ABT4UJ12_9BACT|nr:aldo/keto reductase [Chitinophagaceae bacterium LY-5]
MNKVYLSDAGPKVSQAIYGFWRWQPIDSTKDYEQLEQTILYCLNKGINTFDHADIYGGYSIEEAFGSIIKKNNISRQDIVLFTKCGFNVPHSSRPQYRLEHHNSSAKHIETSVNQSLSHLKTDYIDVLFLNGLDPVSNLEETALTIDGLRQSGKIKNVGIVNFSVFQHQLLASYLKSPIVTNHLDLSLLNTSALDNGQIDFSKQRYMSPLAASPLENGRIENGTDPKAVAIRGKLQELSEKYNTNIESLAVAWLVKIGAFPVIGTQSESRINNIVDAFSVDLDIQDWYDLYNTSKTN